MNKELPGNLAEVGNIVELLNYGGGRTNILALVVDTRFTLVVDIKYTYLNEKFLVLDYISDVSGPDHSLKKITRWKANLSIVIS